MISCLPVAHVHKVITEITCLCAHCSAKDKLNGLAHEYARASGEESMMEALIKARAPLAGIAFQKGQITSYGQRRNFAIKKILLSWTHNTICEVA